MSNPLDNLTKIRQLTDELNPSALQSKVRDFLKGDFRSSSIPDGSPSSETKIPVNDNGGTKDKVDAALRSGRGRYAKNLQTALNALESALRFQNSVLVVAPQLPDLPVVPCANNDCPEILAEGRTKGECVRCRVWRHRHDGLPYPKTLDQEVES